MGILPMSITGVSLVQAGPEPALSEAEGMALLLMGGTPMLRLTPYGVTTNRLLPAKLPEFVLAANEFHGPVVEEHATALGIVVVERKQLRPAVLVPARLRLEQKHHIRRRIRFAVGIHRIMAFTSTGAGTNK